ncbi:hypothetical protein PE051_13595 [Enterobacter asburiae]|uniref:hypothetical protein n=1 Tax=Enterobacter asburiae TaxID=61645 RepID=UPI0031FEA18C
MNMMISYQELVRTFLNTQWQEWPYQSNKEGSVSGYGFKEVSDYMNWVLAQKKSKS